MNNYYQNFTKRNIGIFTKAEQNKLANSAVAIAGVGGIGGLAAERLVRLGITRLKIADPEKFEPSNINRQFGATAVTLGKNKARVVAAELKKINPSVKIKVFSEGITEKNVEKFLRNTNIVIDGIDISVPFKIRSLFYKVARKNKQFIVSSNAIGFGAVLYVFSPDGMSLEEFFEAEENKPNFMPFKKMCPVLPDYTPKNVTKKIVTGAQEYMPTISIGVGLASLWMAGELINIILKKKKIVTVPNCIALDLLNRTIKEFNFGK